MKRSCEDRFLVFFFSIIPKRILFQNSVFCVFNDKFFSRHLGVSRLIVMRCEFLLIFFPARFSNHSPNTFKLNRSRVVIHKRLSRRLLNPSSNLWHPSLPNPSTSHIQLSTTSCPSSSQWRNWHSETPRDGSNESEMWLQFNLTSLSI
jgi:hypothetical protein